MAAGRTNSAAPASVGSTVTSHAAGSPSAAPRTSASAAAATRPPPLPPGVPTVTRLFLLSNPELMFDPKKRASWAVVGGVVAFFSVYIAWAFYTDPPSNHTAARQPNPLVDVRKVLPDGRRLMSDGSIQPAVANSINEQRAQSR
ncbi:hypothetical protein AB1Y20_022083 [Prymnesium parvum]|uniref:Uncharacterized protein n=1 Tax=Prymnesium parvum TaxID=97485 RepID=A0AB34JG30_PRYPA